MIRLITTIIAFIIFSHHSLVGGTTKKLTKEEQQLRLKNEKIVKEQIKKLKKANLAIRVHFEESFKIENVNEYCQKFSALKRQLGKIEKGEKSLSKILQKEKEYKDALEKYNKLNTEEKKAALADFKKVERKVIQEVYDRNLNKALSKSKDKKFLKVTWHLDMDKYNLDIMILENLVKDYRKKNLILPIDWIR